MVYYARLLLYQAASRKDGKVRNSPHLVAVRQLRIALRVHLQHNGSSPHFRSGPLNFGGRYATRAAPGGPEVDQHRNASLANDLIELLNIDFHRLVDWR